MLFFHPILTQTTEFSSMSSRLDRVDLKMLRLLQSSGRLTNAELAEMVGVSAATCHRRTQRLFDEGYVSQVRAMVAPRTLGKGALEMVGGGVARVREGGACDGRGGARPLHAGKLRGVRAGDREAQIRARLPSGGRRFRLF